MFKTIALQVTSVNFIIYKSAGENVYIFFLFRLLSFWMIDIFDAEIDGVRDKNMCE